MTEREWLIELHRLNVEKAWPRLKQRALAGAKEHASSAELAAYVAHALRQLNELDDGWTWAKRAVALDPQSSFAINRVSLLGNLTGHYAEVYALAKQHVDRVPTGPQDAQNLAVTIVNGIFAADKLGTIAEAVTVFTPAIVRLDHDDLHFNSACLYALAGDERVWPYAAKALAAGKDKAAFAERDFDAVRADQRFVALMARDWAAENAALKRAGVRTRAELMPEDFLDATKLAFGAANTERNVGLERAIDADVDDTAGYLVYSDWLQEHGNPLGMLLVASRTCDDAPDESARMLAHVEWAAYAAQHAGALLGAFARELGRNSRTRWRHGFVSELVFDTGSGERKGVNPPRLLHATLALPAFRFLRSLTVGDIAADSELDYAPILDVIYAAELPHLRTLRIEPRAFPISMTSLDVSAVSEHFPALDSLVVGASDLELGQVDLPHLRKLAVHSGGLSRRNFAEVCSARVPELEDLEVWFGSSNYGGHKFDAAALAPLLNKRQPKLRRLGLMNAEFTNAMIEPLARSQLLPYLTALDLSMGTLTDAGAELLVLHAAAFEHLTNLDVSDNAIGDAGCAPLRVMSNVVLGEQKPSRAISVGE